MVKNQFADAKKPLELTADVHKRKADQEAAVAENMHGLKSLSAKQILQKRQPQQRTWKNKNYISLCWEQPSKRRNPGTVPWTHGTLQVAWSLGQGYPFNFQIRRWDLLWQKTNTTSWLRRCPPAYGSHPETYGGKKISKYLHFFV